MKKKKKKKKKEKKEKEKKYEKEIAIIIGYYSLRAMVLMRNLVAQYSSF